MQSHSGVKPFHYDVCAKRFTLRHHLTRHQKIHSGVKLYECSFRDKQFVERAVLSQHMEKHTGKRHYKCFICRKHFANESEMHEHLNVHRSQYKCEECGKCYPRSHGLKIHRPTHCDGEKPFQCEVCGERFPMSFQLVAHHSRKHGKVKRKDFVSRVRQGVHKDQISGKAHESSWLRRILLRCLLYCRFCPISDSNIAENLAVTEVSAGRFQFQFYSSGPAAEAIIKLILKTAVYTSC